ncbi:MAG TPA: phage holin family protein [Vicinamibacterales bacterium]|nr:phage holin family protein [Vicinamibacterales bacterium]
MTFFLNWAVVAAALWVTARIVPGVTVTGWGGLVIGAAVLGLVNTVVRPVLVLLTLPITLLTLGLFYLVVNGAAFGLAAALVPGFEVSSFLSAVLGALVTGLAAWFVGAIVKPGASPGGRRWD